MEWKQTFCCKQVSGQIFTYKHVSILRVCKNQRENDKTPNFSSGKYVNISSVENETIMCLHYGAAFSLKQFAQVMCYSMTQTFGP